MRRANNRHAKDGQKKQAMPIVPVRPFTMGSPDYRQRGPRPSLGMGSGLSIDLEAVMRGGSAPPAPPPSIGGQSRASNRSGIASRAGDPQGSRDSPAVPASRRSRVVKHQYGIQMPVAEDRGDEDNDDKGIMPPRSSSDPSLHLNARRYEFPKFGRYSTSQQPVAI